jgi:riboflavin synthase alpha subunit
MKRQSKVSKLALRKETVRTLRDVELSVAAGGSVAITEFCVTVGTCPTQRICVTTPAKTL